MNSLTKNALGVVAIGSCAYGLWLAWPPLAFVAGGSLALALIVWSHRMETRKDKQQ